MCSRSIPRRLSSSTGHVSSRSRNSPPRWSVITGTRSSSKVIFVHSLTLSGLPLSPFSAASLDCALPDGLAESVKSGHVVQTMLGLPLLLVARRVLVDQTGSGLHPSDNIRLFCALGRRYEAVYSDISSQRLEIAFF
ncbi:hypothetical protein ElyMa_005383600 [Elysia marginata]|uniref:Uncharacterized protein n=1 Tax=Elysia marginata TaxID=1093978 RepID=A0AAV4EE63_9GAST|nr:hypothetical protein ElyMa_005383600 [Elysia marginata]